MAEQIPLYAEPDQANPGEARIKEIPAGDTVAGTFPEGVMGNHSVAAKDAAGNPFGVAVGANQLVGRSETGNIQGLDLAALKVILGVVRGSSGPAQADKLVELGGDGKLSLTLFPQSILDSQANQGESISVGEDTPPPGGFGSIFKAVVNGVMQFRGVITNTPNRVAVSQTPNDVIVNVTVDDSGSDGTALYSAARIDQLISDVEGQISNADLVSDTTPELGGNLDLNGHSIRHDIGGDNLEVLRIETGGPAPVLHLMGQAAVLADLTNPQDDDQLKYDATAGLFVNFTPSGAPLIVAPERFQAILAVDHAIAPDVEEGMPLTDAYNDVTSSLWSQATNEGGGVNFERIRYDSGAGETKRFKVRFDVTAQSDSPENNTQLRIVVAKWDSTSGARANVEGTTRYLCPLPRASASVEFEIAMDDDQELGVMVLHTQIGGEELELVGSGCSVHIQEIQGA